MKNPRHSKEFNQNTSKSRANSTVPLCSALFRQKNSPGTAKLPLGANKPDRSTSFGYVPQPVQDLFTLVHTCSRYFFLRRRAFALEHPCALPLRRPSPKLTPG
jgi:hypothetical protein